MIYSDNPKVAVIIPIRNEPEVVINRMVEALTKIDYSNYEVIVVDNSSSSLKSDFNHFVQKSKFSLNIVRKKDTTGFKAGALNCALRALDNQVAYVLILDVDHAPRPNILKVLVPFLQCNEKRAFVQAAQRFEIKGNKTLSRAYSFQQRMFYDHVCPGMSALNTIFMTGTNTLIRKKTLDEIGGFDESTLTEDLRTSLLFHQKGWQGMYVKETVAVGYPPLDIASYHKQQRRWAIGTFQNFFKAWKSFFNSPNSLKIGQWLQYLGFNGAWYFQGFCNLFLMLSSVVFLSTGFKPHIGILDTFPMILVILTIIYQAINEHNRSKVGYFTLFLSQAIFLGNSVIFVLAFIDLILKRHMSFHVTKKVESTMEHPSFIFTAYHSLFVCVSIIAICFSLRTKISYLSPFFLWPVFFTFQSLMNLLFPWGLYRELNIELSENKRYV
ncbi:MAG: glycosyltransferase [Candidatus Omnitrophica bacterium]|nr:glycosyltransferase [Candidatus Omnitrophota bacterium]